MEALQKLYDLLHTHQVIDPAVSTYTWVFDATPGFFEGTRGMFISWPFVAGVAAIPDASQIAGHSAFAPNPAVVTSGSVDGSEFFGVPVYSENKDEAWRLIDLITSREGQRVVAMGGWGSIYNGVLQEPTSWRPSPSTRPWPRHTSIRWTEAGRRTARAGPRSWPTRSTRYWPTASRPSRRSTMQPRRLWRPESRTSLRTLLEGWSERLPSLVRYPPTRRRSSSLRANEAFLTTLPDPTSPCHDRRDPGARGGAGAFASVGAGPPWRWWPRPCCWWPGSMRIQPYPPSYTALPR